MATMTITTDKGVNSRYPYATSTHIIASATSVGYKIERFKFIIPNSYSNNVVTTAKLTGVTFNGNGYYTILGGSSVAAQIAITSSAGSWSANGTLNPGTEKAIISNFTSIGTVAFNSSSTGLISPSVSFNEYNTILKPGTYYLYLYTNSSAYNERYIDNSGAITLTLTFDYTSYTKCTAPTTIYVGRGKYGSTSEAIFKLNDAEKIYLSWSGAKPGTANSITGYIIYCYYHKLNSPVTTHTIELSGINTSYVFSFPENFDRGEYIDIRIVTKGSAGSTYYSEESTVYGRAMINSLPSAPTIYYTVGGDVINNKEKKVPSAQATISFVTSSDGGTQTKTSQPGSDGNNQNYSIWYKKDTDTTLQEWSNFPSRLTLNLNNKGEISTYTFKTYDGLEYSKAETTITIKRNKKPTFSAKSISTSKYTKYNNDGSSIRYTDLPEISISNKSTGFGTENFTYSYELIINNISYTLQNLTDAASYLSMNDSEYSYAINVYAYDGIEKSDAYLVSDNNYWKIPSNPIIQVHNQYSTSSKISPNIDGTEKSGIVYFEKQLSFCFLQDTRIKTIQIIGENNYLSLNSTNDNQYFYLNKDSNNLTYGKDYQPTIAFFDANGRKIGQASIITSLKKISKLKREYIFEIGMTTFKPFTYNNISTGKGSFTLTNFTTSIDLLQYGLSESSQFIISIANSSNSLTYTLKDTLQQSNDSILSFPFSYDDIYNLCFEPRQNSNLKKFFILSITNIFGNNFIFYNGKNETSILNSNEITINYGEKPTIEEFTLSSNAQSEQGGYFYLKELNDLKAYIKIQSYNENPRFILKVTRTYEDKNETTFYNGTLTSIEGSEYYATNKKPITYEFGTVDKPGYIINPLSQIKKDYTASFELQIITDAGETYKTTEPYGTIIDVKRHESPILRISDSEYKYNQNEQNGQITFKYGVNNTDFGLDTELVNKANTIELYYRTSTGQYDLPLIETKQDQWNKEASMSFSFNMGETSVGYIKLKIITELSDINRKYSKEYSSWSNEIAIYNVSPTIAYRQNHLGINTKELTHSSRTDNIPDGVIYISDSNNREWIYFKTRSSEIKKINIVDGTIDGFVIDGGSWGET